MKQISKPERKDLSTMQKMYQPEIETMKREELRALQLAKLQKQVEHAYRDVPHYKKLLDERG